MWPLGCALRRGLHRPLCSPPAAACCNRQHCGGGCGMRHPGCKACTQRGRPKLSQPSCLLPPPCVPLQRGHRSSWHPSRRPTPKCTASTTSWAGGEFGPDHIPGAPAKGAAPSSVAALPAATGHLLFNAHVAALAPLLLSRCFSALPYVQVCERRREWAAARRRPAGEWRRGYSFPWCWAGRAPILPQQPAHCEVSAIVASMLHASLTALLLILTMDPAGHTLLSSLQRNVATCPPAAPHVERVLNPQGPLSCNITLTLHMHPCSLNDPNDNQVFPCPAV